MANTSPAAQFPRVPRSAFANPAIARVSGHQPQDLRACRDRMGYMRIARAALLAPVIAFAMLTLAFTGQDAAGLCAGSVRCAAQQLPAPITITAGRVDYRIATDGRVSRISPLQSPYPLDAAWFPGTGSWYRIEHTHLVVGRALTPIWRSHEQIAANQLGVIAASPNGVAFQHDHRLYIAPRGGVERPVASRELPLGWTTGGLYTYSYPRHELLLRGDTGTVLKPIAHRPHEYRFDLATGSLYFLSHGMLMGAHGTHVWQLASLHALGMSTNTWLQPLGRLLELMDNRRLALVRPGGSLFASTQIGQLDRISSFIATAADANATAFTAITGSTRHPNAENMYVLRAGAHTARLVHHQPGSFGGCGQWANVTWHGSWLLYSDNNKLAAIDTAGAHHTIELNGLAVRLLRHGEQIDARWTG
jgi:hypothetical protein